MVCQAGVSTAFKVAEVNMIKSTDILLKCKIFAKFGVKPLKLNVMAKCEKTSPEVAKTSCKTPKAPKNADAAPTQTATKGKSRCCKK